MVHKKKTRRERVSGQAIASSLIGLTAGAALAKMVAMEKCAELAARIMLLGKLPFVPLGKISKVVLVDGRRYRIRFQELKSKTKK